MGLEALLEPELPLVLELALASAPNPDLVLT
jgi:hypothetical protein